MTIGNQVYQLRVRRGLTQSELASKTGLPQPNLSNIEKGKQDLTVGTLRRIASVLGCSLSDFFKEMEPQSNNQVFSRERIERLAALAICDKSLEKQNQGEIEIIECLRHLRPRLARLSQPRKTYASWTRLRSLLPKPVIQALCSRMRDAEMRNRKDG